MQEMWLASFVLEVRQLDRQKTMTETNQELENLVSELQAAGAEALTRLGEANERVLQLEREREALLAQHRKLADCVNGFQDPEVVLIVAASRIELSRRILARWGDFDKIVRQAQSMMRFSEHQELVDVSNQIDEMRKAIGGQP